MEKLEHIGIAVKDMQQANALFAALLGKAQYKMEEVASEGVRTAFFDVSGVKIELLEATRPDSPIAKFIEKRGEGIHHLAFEVADLEKSIEDYQAKGFEPINPQPKNGADNKRICFLHPKTTQGVLVELCQEIKDASSR
ncbi:methylmalonyl-CoA epimerase [Dawidia soli]|uniref:Methylmalonyl-CoA epimerase n=1 Tax=Dawidia soli TaxID=2782352 RepID=A0AAP2DE33_9BACT|nr:methylmalonyl-CoA epimerase [Dawidia soli]MBT1689612.1 methylmalonyl-CoA epimerase [Dawidia soli]